MLTTGKESGMGTNSHWFQNSKILCFIAWERFLKGGKLGNFLNIN